MGRGNNGIYIKKKKQKNSIGDTGYHAASMLVFIIDNGIFRRAEITCNFTVVLDELSWFSVQHCVVWNNFVVFDLDGIGYVSMCLLQHGKNDQFSQIL